MMQTVDEFKLAKARLTGDIRSVIADSEELLDAAVNVSGEGFALVREKFEEKLSSAKSRLADASQLAIDNARKTAAVTDDYARDHLWAAVGVFAAVGLLMGIIIARR